MSQVDDIVLDWLDEYEIAVPPKVIYVNIDTAISYSQINRRLRKLEQNGLVHKDPERNDYYAITDLGEKYLHDSDATAADFPDEPDSEK